MVSLVREAEGGKSVAGAMSSRKGGSCQLMVENYECDLGRIEAEVEDIAGSTRRQRDCRRVSGYDALSISVALVGAPAFVHGAMQTAGGRGKTREIM